jgi:hypothetical protein
MLHPYIEGLNGLISYDTEDLQDEIDTVNELVDGVESV